jgi:hypothetical protein
MRKQRLERKSQRSRIVEVASWVLWVNFNGVPFIESFIVARRRFSEGTM